MVWWAAFPDRWEKTESLNIEIAESNSNNKKRKKEREKQKTHEMWKGGKGCGRRKDF